MLAMIEFLSPKHKRRFSLCPSLTLRALVVVFGSAATAFAQPKIMLPAPKTGRIDGLVSVMAQSARCAVVSDVHGFLAFGHDKDCADAQVSLIKLDAKGTPAAYASHIKLPKPVALVKNKNYVTGLAFHPKLPLLYIWQDVDVAYSNPVPPGPAETMQFDHLCIVNFAKDPPERIVMLGRGLDYMHGQQGGSIALDATASFLYVPNLREVKNAGSLRLGRFPLDADGLPIVSEKDAKDPLPVRIKKLTDTSVAGKFLPPQLTPIEYVHMLSLGTFGAGHSFFPVGKDTVITSANQGLMTWRPDDKHATLHGLPLKNAGHTQFVVHPTLPAIFATAYHAPSDSFFRAEHSDGYLTLLPRQYVIEGSKLTSPPAILSKQKKLIVGGEYFVYSLELDDKGFPTGEPTQMIVNCPIVRALVYSERFDRAYIGVEVSK